MIVRKYCKRKRVREELCAKEKNKKDLIEEFRKRRAGGVSTNPGLPGNAVLTKSGPKR
jgi:hypothetical protein